MSPEGPKYNRVLLVGIITIIFCIVISIWSLANGFPAGVLPMIIIGGSTFFWMKSRY